MLIACFLLLRHIRVWLTFAKNSIYFSKYHFPSVIIPLPLHATILHIHSSILLGSKRQKTFKSQIPMRVYWFFSTTVQLYNPQSTIHSYMRFLVFFISKFISLFYIVKLTWSFSVAPISHIKLLKVIIIRTIWSNGGGCKGHLSLITTNSYWSEELKKKKMGKKSSINK